MTTPAREESPLYVAFMGHAVDTERRLVDLHGLLLAGMVTEEEFIALAVQLLGQAAGQAYALADLSLAAWLTAETSTPAPALGLIAPDDSGRVAKGLATLLRVVDQEDPAPRVARYGRAETAGAFQDAYSVGMRERPEVWGWRRRLNVNACELCQWLWKGGKVYPADRSFHRHPGCGCHPEPVLRR